MPVNWAKPRIDRTVGRVEETEVAKRLRAGEKVELQPRWTGGKNWFPMAFNPNKGLVYAAPWDLPRLQNLAPPRPQVIARSKSIEPPRSKSRARGQPRWMFRPRLSTS